MKIIYAPRWLLGALAASGTSQSTLADPKALSKLCCTLSPEDVASFVVANEGLQRFVPKAVVNSFEPPVFDLEDPSVKAVKDAYQRLWVSERGALPAEAGKPNYKLTSMLLDDTTVVVYYFEAQQATDATEKLSEELSFLKRLIRQVCMIVPFERMVTYPIVARYLTVSQKLLVTVQR